MSNIVGFWAPLHGVAGATTTMISMALYLSIVEEKRVLITTTQSGYYSRISEFLNLDQSTSDPMTQIHSFSKLNQLSQEKLELFTQKVDGVDLYVLDGPVNAHVHSDLHHSLDVTLRVSRETFDYVFIDFNAGSRMSEIDKVAAENLNGSITLLPQDDQLISKTFEDLQRERDSLFVPEVPNLYVIGRYMEYQHLNIRRMRRRYNMKDLFSFSQSEALSKAVFRGDLADKFFVEASGQRDEFSKVFLEVKDISKALDKILSKVKK